MLDWQAAEAVAATHGASFFLLDDNRFRANFTDLLSAFRAHYPDVHIGYSYKTNYTPHLCRIVHELGGYAEVVSGMEYALAKRLGISGARIIFNGPYKDADTFAEAALGGATINLDSLRDVDLLKGVTGANPKASISVGIRCNFTLGNDQISRFGLDVDGAEFRAAIEAVQAAPGAILRGLHCHFPDRELDSFGRRARRMAELAKALFPAAPPEFINIGGGYFSNMPETLRKSLGKPVASFADYGRVVGDTLTEALGGRGAMPALFIEPGTALVADVLRFYTRVISIKEIRGRKFATVAGSIFDISPSAREKNLPVTGIHAHRDRAGTAERFDIAGYTCIEGDILSFQLEAPLEVGDFLCFENVGSYSVVMKPPFILPANPVLVATDRGFEVIKERETAEQVFRNFRF
jgi:diaminopimelate decarboxylase